MAIWYSMLVVMCLVSATSALAPVLPIARIHSTGGSACRQQALCLQMQGTDRTMVQERPAPSNLLSRLLLGFRDSVEQKVADGMEEVASPWLQDTSPDDFTVRPLTKDELSDTGKHGKLELVAKLCTKGMFGEDKMCGSDWVLRNFNVKYGTEALADNRQSKMLVVETQDGEIVGCVGMELMLITDDGMAWWANPCSVVKKRPFVSDLVVDSDYRCVFRA